MSDQEDEERTAQREQMRAAPMERETVDWLKLQALEFDWRNSPRIEHGVVSGHSIKGPTTLEVALSRVSLSRETTLSLNPRGGLGFCLAQ